jgi:hypothetical protein
MSWRTILGLAAAALKPRADAGRTPAVAVDPAHSVNSVNCVNRGCTPESDPAAMLQAAAAAAGLDPAAVWYALGSDGRADLLEGALPAAALEAFAASIAGRWAQGWILPGDRPAAGEDPVPLPWPMPEQDAAVTPGRADPLAVLADLPLMPEDRRYFSDRVRFRQDRSALVEEFGRVWRAAAEAEPVEHRQANAGRKAASAWLRQETQPPVHKQK